MSNSTDHYAQLIHSRRSIRKFDQQHDFNHQAVKDALELALLSPNSSNMQLWEFHRVASADKREQMVTFCLGQNAAKTANELVVFTVTPRKWKARAKMNSQHIRNQFEGRSDKAALRAFKYYEKLIPMMYNNDRLGVRGVVRKCIASIIGIKKPMVREVTKSDFRICLHKSASLAAMTFMTSMRDQGYDTCPMEGFDSTRVKQLLGLEKSDEICMIVSCGKRTEEGVYGERQRVERDDVIYEH